MTQLERLLLEGFLGAYPSEAARSLEQLPASEVASVLNDIDPQSAAEVLRRMAPPAALACLNTAPARQAATTLSRLPVAISANLLRRMEPDVRAALLEAISPEHARPIRSLMSFPEKTVGALMNPLAPVLPEDLPVSQASKLLQQLPYNVYYYLYVADRGQRLAGFLAAWELFGAPSEALLGSIMRRDRARLSPNMGFQSLVVHPGWSQADELPVVDEQGLFLGAIQHRSLRVIQDPAGQSRPSESPLGAFLELGQLYSTAMHGLLQGLTPPEAYPGPTHSGGKRNG